jgi:hypothetical protein
MKVYVVVAGEKYQGGDVRSVHSKKKDAIKAALSTDTCFSGGWVPDLEDGKENCWTNGCDFVTVQAHKVL